MALSAFDLFRVGIGPSSSHTVGPMKAAADFIARIEPASVRRLEVELYGSLAATGRGHGTLTAVLLGLEGREPDRILPREVEERRAAIATAHRILLGGSVDFPFDETDIVLSPWTRLPGHSNALRLRACDPSGAELDSCIYYSIGGGFIRREGEEPEESAVVDVPFPFSSAEELLSHCGRERASIADIARSNERMYRSDAEIDTGWARIRGVMEECVAISVRREGALPGLLAVPRRAHEWRRKLVERDPTGSDPALWQEWVNLVAIAVNEENATGGRIVTAPTNGAAGIVPAVLHYALRFTAQGAAERERSTTDFFLTAAAIGAIIKMRASVSGAEVGCQGEVGSASSMAAAGLAAVLGGTPAQVENAAEIAMEHSLGLTCDPVGGLVQIPCIERNAVGAVKAITAARMALWGDGTHVVSLDTVIETMRQTGADMSDKYKETSLGGLAVNVVEC